MVHPHHSNLAFVRTTGNTADTFAPHRRSFGTRRLFHQTRSVQPAVSSVFCFHRSSSRPFHERLNHGFFPASFVLSTAVCVHCNISELFTLRAITHSLIVVSTCVTRSVVIHPISPPAISSTATTLSSTHFRSYAIVNLSTVLPPLSGPCTGFQSPASVLFSFFCTFHFFRGIPLF